MRAVMGARPAMRYALVGVAVLAGIAGCALLATRAQLFAELPGWRWFATDKGLVGPARALALTAVGAALVGWAALPSRRAFGWRVAGVWLSGYALELILADAEGNARSALRHLFLDSGHGRFVYAAIDHGERPDLIASYLDLARRGVLGEYAPTKPPGQILSYVFTESFARWLTAPVTRPARIDAVVAVASVAWPALAAAVVFPLAGATRRFTGSARAGVLAACLYVTTPSFLLIQMHTDQVLFPLLTTGALWLGCVASGRSSVAVAALGAAVFCVALFCSYGLVTFAPILAAPLCLSRWPGRARRALWATLWAATFVLVTAGAYLWLRRATGFDWLEGLRLASERHAEWQGWDPAWRAHAASAGVNLLEHSWWLGAPVAVWSWTGIAAQLGAGRRAWTPPTALAAGLVLFFVGVLAFGKTRSEVARLWLFVVPVMCAVAATRIDRAPPAGRGREGLVQLSIGAVVAAQLAFTACMKAFMDFR
jgi:hypothetical protein